MRLLQEYLKAAIDVFELLLFFIGVYYTLVGLFSFFGTPVKRRRGSADGDNIEKNKFAIIVPAHNEEKALPGLLRSLYSSEYPKELYRVYVISDNCGDGTAEIARKHGATVVERFDGSSLGKNRALSYAFEYLQREKNNYDCYVVVDADNAVDVNFLDELNEAFRSGSEVVQGYVDSKNPYENWLSAAYSMWYWIENRIRQTACHNLGLGCKLSGTGFAFKKEVLDAVPWTCESLAEDLEYTVLLSLSGIKIDYAKYAVVYDEKPARFKNSVMQRLRWCKGIVDVQGRYGFKLLKKRKLCAWLNLYAESLSLICYAFFLIIGMLAAISNISGLSFACCELWTNPISAFTLNLYLFGNLLIVICGLIIDKKMNKLTFANLFGFILYILSWIPIGIIGFFRHNNKNWYHTKHSGSFYEPD